LENLIDPLGNTTSWSRDLEGRVTRKIYEDGTAVQYAYENTTSRLKQMTDAKNQSTVYVYNQDNALQQISYSNAVVATPSVTFTYDANYNRVVTMVDTNGTTTYNYNAITGTALGAGRLASVVGPLANSTITYSYDQVGRVTNRAINAVADAVTYDNLGRVMIVSNALGVFSNKYIGVTARLNKMTYPNGQTLTNTYFGNSGDRRLQEILNRASGGSTISKFDYTYDAEGEIQSWAQQMGTTNNAYGLQYDAASQLVDATMDATMNGTLATNTYSYAYDAAGNRLSERINGAMNGAAYNNVNELVSRSGSGALRFRGSVNEPISNATVSSNAAVVDSGTNFTGYATVSSVVNTVQVQVADYYGHVQANYFQVTVSNGASQTLTYDLNGNLVTMSNATTVISNVWDAANRLVAIYSNSTYASLFAYDGFGRRVRQTEIASSTTNGDRWLLWCGLTPCEERDSTGATVMKRFLAQGEQTGGTNYFFSRDHLGSVREMTDTNGTIRARYNYDPWGRRTKVSGDLDADFGFTGHYYHPPSGLHLALYRAYSADLGRWISRDPLENAELEQGPNLYAYVQENPVDLVDPLGLDYLDCVSSCVERHRDPLATSIGATCNTGLNAIWGRTPRGGIAMGPHATDWEHRFGGWLSERTGILWFGRAGRAIGRLAIWATLVDGLWDWSVIMGCSAGCASHAPSPYPTAGWGALY
jgi:RHS repeat-associated protein